MAKSCTFSGATIKSAREIDVDGYGVEAEPFGVVTANRAKQ
jgi:hypothetical protein